MTLHDSFLQTTSDTTNIDLHKLPDSLFNANILNSLASATHPALGSTTSRESNRRCFLFEATVLNSAPLVETCSSDVSLYGAVTGLSLDGGTLAKLEIFSPPGRPRREVSDRRPVCLLSQLWQRGLTCPSEKVPPAGALWKSLEEAAEDAAGRCSSVAAVEGGCHPLVFPRCHLRL